MGLLEDWDLTVGELNDILGARPSVRGILFGFVAEYKLSRMWFADPRVVALERYDNHARQRTGDFGFTYRGLPLRVEVKSLQTNSIRQTEAGYVGTFQCDANDRRQLSLPTGGRIQTTCLRVGTFDLLAVNVFEFENKWRFAFAKNGDLPRSTYRGYTPEQRQYLLATSIRITWPPGPPFCDEPFRLLDEIVVEKGHRG